MIFDDPLPKISCLTVTAKGRFAMLEKSVQCYLNQTYSNKELIIVSDGDSEYQSKIKDSFSRNDIKLIFLKGKYSLGSLRNISIACCEGDLFVQWDDDDFNMPERLAVQFHHLKNNSQCKVSFLSDQLHYYISNSQIYWEDWKKFHNGGVTKYSLIPGTIMAWSDKFSYRYPNAKLGEDSFISDLFCKSNESEICLLSGYGYLQVYSFHGQNAWDIDHHLDISKCRSKYVQEILPYQKQICGVLDYLKFNGTVSVCGRDGLAFTHEVL